MLLVRPVCSTGEPRTAQNMGLHGAMHPRDLCGGFHHAFTLPGYIPEDNCTAKRLQVPFEGTYELTLRLLTCVLI